MNSHAGKDYWLYSAVFYMCRTMGVLPLVKNAHFNPSIHICESNKGAFAVSRWGLMFNVVHTLLLTFFSYQLVDWNNLLTTHSLYWIQNTSSALSSTLLSLFRISSLSDLISTAYTIYYLCPHKSFSCFLVFLLVQPFLPIVYQLFWLPFLDYDVNLYLTTVNYVTTHNAAIEVIVSTLCFIATNALLEINQQLKTYQTSKFDYKSIFKVKQHMENHIFVSKYVRNVSAHFSVNFLNTFLSFISRTIIFVFFSISNLKNEKYLDVMVFAFTNCYIVFCVFFCCYCCQKVKDEQIKTLIIVRRTRVLWIDKITEDEALLLDTYEELMEVTAVEFSACGLFPVNVEQGLHVLGIIITYVFVAAQAQ